MPRYHRIASTAVALIGIATLLFLAAGSTSAQDRRGPPPGPDLPAPEVLDALAAKCGSELDWATDWTAAAAQARRDERPILVYARFLSGFAMTDSVMAGTFMDPDVVELVQARFVPLRVSNWESTPLRDRARYGLSRTALGAALLVCTPGGEVVTELPVFEPSSVYRALAEAPPARTPSPADTAPPDASSATAAAAQALARDGELERALSVLDALGEAAPARLRASVLRRMGDGAGALAALAGSGAPVVEPLDLHLDRASIHLRMGDLQAAERSLTAYDRQPDSRHPRLPELVYRIGELQRRTVGNERAEKIWALLVTDFPGDRWAWKAAAQMRGTAWKTGSGERIEWLDDVLLAAATPSRAAPVELDDAAAAHAAALRYLLEQQRADGSWACPAEAAAPAGEIPHPFSRAITAICATELLHHGDVPAARVATKRALVFLDDAWSRVDDAPPQRGFMDYRPWADAYEIAFFAEALGAELDAASRLRGRIDQRVMELAELQKSTGGWSYYLGHSLTRTSASEASISFTTAAVLRAFGRALDVGAELPSDSFQRGAQALERMRYDGTTFSYFLQSGAARGTPSSRSPGAAGRGAVCDLALIRAGKGTEKNLRRSLALFFRHDGLLAREAGKALMHCGDDAQGSHYVLFDYANVADGIALLPEKEREAPRRRLLELLLRTRTEDGAFVDNPLIGRAFGAGMALHVFRVLGVPATRER